MSTTPAEQLETPAAPFDESDPAFREDMTRLMRMLEESDVEGARRYVKELELRWPDAKPVQHYARVLAPPVARIVPGRRGRSLDREHAWLRIKT